MAKDFKQTMVDFKQSLESAKSDAERFNLYERCYQWLNGSSNGLNEIEKLEAQSKLIYSMIKFVEESSFNLKEYSTHWDSRTVKAVFTYIESRQKGLIKPPSPTDSEANAKFGLVIQKIENCKDFPTKAFCYCILQDRHCMDFKWFKPANESELISYQIA